MAFDRRHEANRRGRRTTELPLEEMAVRSMWRGDTKQNVIVAHGALGHAVKSSDGGAVKGLVGVPDHTSPHTREWTTRMHVDN
jgi:hypothetical protein